MKQTALYLTLILGLFMALFFFSADAQADPKISIWKWQPEHWQGLDYEPYLEPAKPPHNSQWNDSPWRPSDWISRRADSSELINGFYQADIIRAQYLDNDVPVLKVGPGFYRLGGEDKRRVAAVIDEVYQITANELFGIYLLYDWQTNKTVGVYTPYGLQLQ